MKRNIQKLCYWFFTAILFLSSFPVAAVSYQWEAQGNESGFFIEIPEEYRWNYRTRKNGVIVTFTYESAGIEIRSFTDDSMTDLSLPELINQKAARLAAVYNGVRLLYEKPSAHRSDLYLASWEIIHQGARYTEQTAIWKDNDKIIAVSCVAPTASLSRYQIAFENAIFSLLPESSDQIPQFLRTKSINIATRAAEQETKPKKEEKPVKKKEEKKETPKKQEPPKKEEKKETKPPEKTVPPKKEEDKKAVDMDSFLPPIK